MEPTPKLPDLGWHVGDGAWFDHPPVGGCLSHETTRFLRPTLVGCRIASGAFGRLTRSVLAATFAARMHALAARFGFAVVLAAASCNDGGTPEEPPVQRGPQVGESKSDTS